MDVKTYSKNEAEVSMQAVRRAVPDGVTLHWHDCCEVELVLTGRGTHVINGHSYSLEPGDLYFFSPADCHSIAVEEPITVLGIMFDEKLVEEEIYTGLLAMEMTGADLLVKLGGDKRAAVEAYFTSIVREADAGFQGMFAKSYVIHLLNSIIICLLREMGNNVFSIADRQPMMKAILYLHRHYAENITLTSLASHLYLSPSYLSACFKTNIGRSFKDYLIGLRLSHACRLLVNTKLSVTDICYQCGFSSFSHFMRTFRAHYDMTPLQFRRQHKQTAAKT